MADVCWRGDSGYRCALAKGDGSFHDSKMALERLKNGYATSGGGNNDQDNYSTISHPDFNGDGTVDILDVVLVVFIIMNPEP